MSTHRSILLVAILALAAIGPLASLGGALGPPGEGGNDPACDPSTVVDNEDLRIWLQGKKGQLKVFKKNETTGGIDGMYQYKQLAITELNDENETVATLNLENAEPMDSACTVERSGDWVNVTYTVTDEVRTPANDGPGSETADVTFAYHFDTNSSEAKFDLRVEQWPWQSDGELAYDFEVTSGEWEIEAAENGLGFRDGDTGEPEALIQWAPNATATYEDGREETAVVNSTVDGGAHHVTVALRFTQASPGYVDLDYDPTVAVGPYVIVAGLLVSTSDIPEPVRRLVLSVI